MDEYIQNQAIRIQAAAKEVEMARLALQTVMQERKAHEKLKENAFQAFLKEEQAEESKAIDGMTTYSHVQKLIGEQDYGK